MYQSGSAFYLSLRFQLLWGSKGVCPHFIYTYTIQCTSIGSFHVSKEVLLDPFNRYTSPHKWQTSINIVPMNLVLIQEAVPVVKDGELSHPFGQHLSAFNFPGIFIASSIITHQVYQWNFEFQLSLTLCVFERADTKGHQIFPHTDDTLCPGILTSGKVLIYCMPLTKMHFNDQSVRRKERTFIQ